MYLKNAIHSIFWGIIIAGMSLIFQLIVISLFLPQTNLSTTDKDFFGSLIFLILYAVSEEAFKYFIVIKKIIPLSYGKTFIINAWLAGVGFSLVEAFMIYQKNIAEKINFSFMDITATAPFHILTFGILGYFLSTTPKKGLQIKVLLFNIILHLVYNYSIIYLNYYSFPIKSIIMTLILGINIFGLLTVNKKLASD